MTTMEEITLNQLVNYAGPIKTDAAATQSVSSKQQLVLQKSGM